MKNIIDNFTYIVFLGYIAFIPSGPYPIPILGTKLDILLGIILLILVVPKILQLKNYYPTVLLMSLWLYLIATFLSVIFSDELLFSTGQWLITLGYILTCFLAPIAAYHKIQSFRTALLVIATIVALLLISQAIFFGIDNVQRIYLGFDSVSGSSFNNDVNTGANESIVDPNMTAIGLMMTILFYLPNFADHSFSKQRKIFEVFAFILITLGAILTLSRTAIVSFILSCLITSLVLALDQNKLKNSLAAIWKSVKTISIFSAFFLVIYILFPTVREVFIDRLLSSGSQEDSHRISIMSESIEIFQSTDKNIFFGKGFFTTNPHNEILRNLSSSGLIGLITFLVFLSVLYFFIVRKVKSNYWLSFSATSIYFYIFIATQTYGHTKSMWSAFMFLLFFYLENKLNTSNTRDAIHNIKLTPEKLP